MAKRQPVKMVDMHCHFLPGVDDGSSDMEQTIAMLQIAAEEGIEAIIATPHYKNSHHCASPETLQKKIATVEEEAHRQGILISLYLGNEIFYFNEIVEKLDSEEIFTLNNTDRVLIEFSPSDDYTHIRNSLDSVAIAGYVPILAHVERYACMLQDYKRVDELKHMGVEIQINVASVGGSTGWKTKRFCYELIKNQWVDYVGTDAHDDVKRVPNFQKCYRVLSKKFDPSYVEKIFYRNALEIINAE